MREGGTGTSEASGAARGQDPMVAAQASAAELGRLKADRRQLHRIAELGLDLPQTTAYVDQALSGLACEVEHPLPSCVTAYFDFGAATTMAFRCDMDALPIAEPAGTDFASEHVGVMHACGHDGHMAIMLELCRFLSGLAEKGMQGVGPRGLPLCSNILAQGARCETAPGTDPSVPGGLVSDEVVPCHNVLVIFQPGEEHPGGARLVCETGLLERRHVGCAFGLHLWPEAPAGTVETRPGAFLAQASEVNVDVTGVSAHAAKQRLGADALAASARIALAMGEAAASERALGNPCVVNVGRMEAGTVRNAVAANGRVEGTIRTFQHDSFERVTSDIRAAADAEHERDRRISATVDINEGYPAVINDKGLASRILAEVPGVIEAPEPSMIADDFSFYQQRVPGCYFFLGTGRAACGLHAPDFVFDESILVPGAELFKTIVGMDWTAQMRVATQVPASEREA